MSQHSLNTDVNVALAALGSTMKGPAAPPAPLAGMLWLDDNTTPWVLKIFDGADWIPLGLVDPASNAFIADGLAAGRFFAPKANDPADLRVKLEAGLVFDVTTQTLTAVASQQTSSLTAPTIEPRKDIVYVDRLTGILGVATGTEAASPVDPTIPAGKLPVARINWTAGATAITTTMIDDIRVLNALGLGALAILNYVTDLPQNVSLSGDITPPTITADQNNYNPDGLATASTLRLTANGARAITGISGGTDGRLLILHNIDTPKITLKTESTSSTAGNRLALNSDITLAINQAALLQYDSVSQRWRAVAVPCKDNSNIGQLQRSLRFNRDDGAYLNRKPTSATNRTVWTFSCWLKRCEPTGSGVVFEGIATTDPDDNFTLLECRSDGSFGWQHYFSSVPAGARSTAALFRDPLSWYHLVWIWDSNSSVAADRSQIWVNGIKQAYSGTGSDLSSGATSWVNFPEDHKIGAHGGAGNNPLAPASYNQIYLTDVHFIDGQALTPTAFGAFDAVTGVWMPKKYEGTYGNNGFHLDFSDNSGTTSATLGRDRSGNNNDWTPNNFSVSAGPGNDSLVDIPVNADDGSNGKGNYCTWNPLIFINDSVNFAPITYSEGNLKASLPTVSKNGVVQGTLFVSSGAWHFEVTCDAIGNKEETIGIGSMAASSGVRTNFYGYRSDGQKISASGTATYGASWTAGDTISVAVDFSGQTITFYKNGVSQGTAFTSITQDNYAPDVRINDASSGTRTHTLNAGQRPFAYPAPEGFKALNTQNLPEPAIVKPAERMDAVLYTGNGSTQTISGIGFQPDLVWLKSRSSALDHKLTDAVRSTTKALVSNTADAESTDTNGLTAFNSDGFALGSDATYNTNAATYVAWAWKTGTTPGLDIVSYTGDGNAGRTVSHGLGAAPAFVIVKNRTDNSTDWAVWHQVLANTEGMNLNTDAAKFSATGYWNSTTPSTSVLTLGTSASVNASSKSYVAYLWAEAAGFSRFGSYTGNGSTDGPFVWCGFRPRFVLTKRVDTIGHWWIGDAGRNPYNVTNLALYADGSAVEESVADSNIDILANGFKCRDTSARRNQSGGTYIFAAFAESPFKYARAR